MEIKVSELNSFYQKQLNEAIGKHDTEGMEGAPAGAMAAVNLIDLGGAKETFCEGWKQAGSYLPFLTWVPFLGKYVAVIVAAMKTADKYFVSDFCKVAATATVVHTNVSQDAR